MNRTSIWPGRAMHSIGSLFLLVALTACAASRPTLTDREGTSAPVSKPGLVGKSQFEFTDWAGPPLPVWTYTPEQVNANTPIVFIMHGAKRDPERYRDDWVGLAGAAGFILVAPEFSKADFPGSRNYNLGAVFAKGGAVNPRERWSYSSIEPIFDAVKRRTGSRAERYSIYGHSAGAQFVHRFMYFVPDARVSCAVAANAGWYTLPDFDVEFPYGLKAAPASELGMSSTLAKKLLILLGTEDNDPEHKSLRRTPQANAQGAHRFARGHAFFDAGTKAAEKRRTSFAWELVYAPGVGHKNARMAEFAAPLLRAPERNCRN